MSERSLPRPPTFERWVDREVGQAIARGDFDGLAGAGRPLPDLDEPHDDLRWLRKKLADEDLAVLPPSLLLRKEVEQLLQRADAASTEADVRRLVDEANTRIRRANRLGITGPPHNLVPYDPAAFTDRWRRRQPAAGDGDDGAPAPPTVDVVASARRRWWRRNPSAGSGERADPG